MALRVRERILFIAAITLLLAIGANTLFLTGMFRQEHSEALESELEVIAGMIKAQLERLMALGIPAESIEGFEAQCREMRKSQPELEYVFVATTGGQILFHDDPSRLNTTVSEPGIMEALKRGVPVSCISYPDGTPHHNLVMPVGNSGVSVVVGFPSSVIDAKIARLRKQSAFIAGGSLLVAIALLMTSLSVSVTKPLSGLVRAIHTIRENSDLDTRVEVLRNDEIGELAESFNQLIEDLNHTTVSRDLLAGEVAERKKAEEALAKLNLDLEATVQMLDDSNRQLQEFAYVASHDLREPLRKITSFGKLLEESIRDKLSEDDAENLDYMIDGAERMSKMIEALLMYSRINTKGIELQPVDLNEIVDELEQFELSVKIEETGANVEIPRPLPVVQADPVQLRQLMQNLIANGIKYQKPGNKPRITVTARPQEDDFVRIEVTDNGIGIDPESHKMLFGMFRRLHSASQYEGTGIGLAVCKRIIERHNGTIGLESQKDEGSTFWFTIAPAAEQQNAPAEKPDSPETAISGA